MTRLLFNPKVAAPPEPPSRDALEYHRRLPGYHPTPLVHAERIAGELGLGHVWVKDESSRLGLPSFKILGASWGMYRALQSHLGPFEPWERIEDLAVQLKQHLPQAVAAATDGNHGRAVARMASLLGLEAHIFVPKGTAAARIQAIESEGALCEVVDGTYDDAVARSAGEASDACLVISDTSWDGYEQVPGWVIEGYSTIFWEIDDQLQACGAARPDAVIVQVGVGALGAAAIRHFRHPGPPPVWLVAIEPEHAACVLASVEAGRIVTVPGPHDSIMAGLNCGTPSVVAWPYVSSGFDCYVALGDGRARDGMKLLAREGMVSGETGAAGLGGLLELLSVKEHAEHLRLNQDSSVLVISTEGATDPESYGRIVGRAPSSVRPERDLLPSRSHEPK